MQLAFLTKGEHDLMIFMLTEAGAEGTFNLYRERELIFPECNARWYRAPVYITYNFIPMREEFFEILKERIWKRSKEVPRPPSNSISAAEYSVLRELSKSGTMDFTAIDEKYGFDRGRAQYEYRKLKAKGIIKRITLSLTALPIKNLAVIYVENVNDKSWEEAKPKFLAHIVKETGRPINFYAFEGDTGIPNGTMFVLPAFSDADIEEAEKELSAIKNARITTSLVASVLVGNLCFRRFDNAYTRQYSRLITDFRLLEDKPKIRYE